MINKCIGFPLVSFKIDNGETFRYNINIKIFKVCKTIVILTYSNSKYCVILYFHSMACLRISIYKESMLIYQDDQHFLKDLEIMILFCAKGFSLCLKNG